jgi:hypothetical protein
MIINFYDLSQEQIDAIHELAASLTLPSDIAKVLQISSDYFLSELQNEMSEIHNAFYSGFLKTQDNILRSINPATDKDAAVFDPDVAIVRRASLAEFKSKLIIQLYGS